MIKQKLNTIEKLVRKENKDRISEALQSIIDFESADLDKTEYDDITALKIFCDKHPAKYLTEYPAEYKDL